MPSNRFQGLVVRVVISVLRRACMQRLADVCVRDVRVSVSSVISYVCFHSVNTNDVEDGAVEVVQCSINSPVNSVPIIGLAKGQ